MNSALAGLYGITDPLLLPDSGTLTSAVEAALKGGMRLLQYRAKTTPDTIRLEQATALHQLCQRYGALFIINDNVALAKAVNAHGVHLGRHDAAISVARAQLGARAIIGCSCYDQLELALDARQQGADYVAFGRFFPSKTKPQATSANPDLLTAARARLDIPICAIGGISTRNASQLIERGAHMIAVIDDLFSAQDIAQKASEFSELLRLK